MLADEWTPWLMGLAAGAAAAAVGLMLLLLGLAALLAHWWLERQMRTGGRR